MSIRESAPRLPGLPPMNRLLSTLSAQELGRIKQQLCPVSWEADHILLEPMEPVRYVCFPETCVISLSVALEQGITCEAGIIGSDGVVGYESFLGNDLALSRYVVQVAGIALQLPVKPALSAFASNSMFHDLLMHYVSALHAETLQSVACHGLHTGRSEEHPSELQSLMRIQYAVFCLKKKKITNRNQMKVKKKILITIIRL